MTDSRFPYTYSCDFIRALSGYNSKGTKLSRSDASQIRQGIAKAIGMNDEELAILLATAESKKIPEDYDREAEECRIALGI